MRLFNRLDRYIAREMVAPLLIGTVAVAMMFQANQLIALFRNLQMGDVPTRAILQYILFKTPEFLMYTLPVGVALASSLALSRMVRDSEITVMRAAGASILRLMRPVVLMGLLVSSLHWAVSEYAIPNSAREARRLENEMGALSLAPTFRQNVMIALQRYTASFGTVQRLPNDEMLLTDILLIERRSIGENLVVIAPEGRYFRGVWRIHEPLTMILRGASVTTAESDSELTIEEPISVPQFFFQPLPAEQTSAELREALREARERKTDSTRIEVALHQKTSVPFTGFVFAITGAAMALWTSRRGPFFGVLMSMGVVLLYYNLYIISTEIFGKNAWVPPLLSAWVPNLLMLGFGLIVLRRCE